MSQLTSWNGQLPTDLLLDSGILYIGATIFSAQEGGLKWDEGRTIREVEFDGKRSRIKGLDRTVQFKPVLSGTILELPASAFLQLEPGSVTTVVAGGPSGAAQYWPKPGGVLYAAGDYLTNVRAVWQRGDGTYFQVRMPSAVCIKWALAGQDKQEGKFAIEIEAALDMTVSGQLTGNPPFVYEYYPTGP